MRTVDVNNLTGTDKDVLFTGGNSLRAVLMADNLGFAVMKTVIPKGGPYFWHYNRHKEVCYCISGKGVLTDYWSGEQFIIKPDVMYIQDKNEEHTFEALEDTVLISIFNPPLIGNEKHDANGNY
jgi:L-ectoine synthase